MANSDSNRAASTSTATLSPPAQRRPKKKKSDPFLELPLSEHLASEETENAVPSTGPASDESLLTKVFMTPVVFVSFILSLVLVERRNRAWRTSQHSSSSNQSWSLRSWLNPEPYQYPDSTGSPAKSGEDDPVPQPEKSGWFARKKHRKMAKLQVDEAFEGRDMVVLGLTLLFVVFIVATMWTLKTVVVWLVEHYEVMELK